MSAEILQFEDGTAIVEVYDRLGNRHLVEVDAEDDGEIGRHGQDVYPRDPEERTDEQERMMFETDTRAQYEVHRETEYDLFEPGWDPEALERGIEALRKMPTDEFADAFEDYYRALKEPERVRRDLDVTEGNVEFRGEPEIVLIQKGFCIDDRDEIVSVVPDVYVYYSTEGEDTNYGAGTPVSCSAGETLITAMLPPIESEADDYSFPEDFKQDVLGNLTCQVRDVYRNMGEDPPARFDVEGFGKPKVIADVEW